MSNDTGESDVTPTESKIISTVGNFPHGNREIPETSAASMAADRSEKAKHRTSDMHVSGKSDSFVVPRKRANKAGQPTAAESVEGRRLTKENAGQSLLDRTQRRTGDGKPFQPRSRGLSKDQVPRPHAGIKTGIRRLESANAFGQKNEWQKNGEKAVSPQSKWYGLAVLVL